LSTSSSVSTGWVWILLEGVALAAAVVVGTLVPVVGVCSELVPCFLVKKGCSG